MRAEGPGSERGDDGATSGGGPSAQARSASEPAPRETSKQPVRSEYTGEMPVVTDTDERPQDDIRGT
jgi:hypothetical protein